MKNLFDLSIEELQEIENTGIWPEGGVDFLKDPTHPLFRKIFDNRNDPGEIARVVLKDRGIKSSSPKLLKTESIQRPYMATLPLDFRRERLEIKRRELELKESKVKKIEFMYEELVKIDRSVKTLSHQIDSMHTILKKMITIMLKGRGE